MGKWDCVIVGTGPAGLGAAFALKNSKPDLKILMIDRERYSTGGLRNDCKMNFTFPIGFPAEYWNQESADSYLTKVAEILQPPIMDKFKLDVYQKRAERLDVTLLSIKQAHLGTDGGLKLIKELVASLKEKGVEFSLGEEATGVKYSNNILITEKREIEYKNLIIAPGRKGFKFLQDIMNNLDISYYDNIVDIGIRVESHEALYPIVRDYYDPKFLFPGSVRTFCTNSRAAYVVQEKYISTDGVEYYSVNGHAWSDESKVNNLVNFALLKTSHLTHPVASGQKFAEILGLQANLCGGGRPIMQRVGDFRIGKRSSKETFNNDLYDFKPTLKSCTPGDISLVVPYKIMKSLWTSMKLLDTVIPGILHPSTIMYYPEIKMYANKPKFLDENFQAKKNIYLIGDGAGTSRGITVAWASGIRAADGILKS
ncbi:MAG: FAD-dependent oxidoreductase [Spirochaetaceae bacterium]|nr:FAD-dependent oxidoreductase [Spirochaetaceae bacterium]